MGWREELSHPRERIFATIWASLALAVFVYLVSLLWEIHKHGDWPLFWTPPSAIWSEEVAAELDRDLPVP